MGESATTQSGVVVTRVGVEEIIELRRRILRADHDPTSPHFSEDQDEETVHLAVMDPASGQAVTCSTWFSDARQDAPQGRADWRLRGMATAPTHQGLGLGTALLRVGLHEGAARGHVQAWCNARVTAIPFYAANGWIVASAAFTLPQGPHRLMVIDLRA
jgi:GNAT superfamily N-acetyltransferase